MTAKKWTLATVLFLVPLVLLYKNSGSSPNEISKNGDVDPRPNIIVIMTDDQPASDMVGMPKTQNLLGSKGITFKNSFVDFPFCCPSRASFLTGQAAHNHGILGNFPSQHGGYWIFKKTQRNSLPVWLQQSGYHTAHFGKYLNGFRRNDPIPPGWSSWFGIDDGGHNNYDYTINENGVRHHYGDTPADYKTDVLAAKTSEFILSQQGSHQPLFIWLATTAPHDKILEDSNIAERTSNFPEPAPRHVGKFKTMKLPLTPNFNELDVSDKPSFLQFGFLKQNQIEFLTERFRKRRESVLAVDDMVEKIVETLETAGKLSNTYIFFTSDNGWMSGEHRRMTGKLLAYEESIRVPLLIRGPAIAPGQVRNQLVNNLDMVATIEELSGIKPGRIPDGHSLTDLFKSGSAQWRTSILVQGIDKTGLENGLDRLTAFDYIRRYQAVRTERYKYIEHFANRKFAEAEFYDLADDPYELVNESKNSNFASVIRELKSRLFVLRNCFGPSCWITTPGPE